MPELFRKTFQTMCISKIQIFFMSKIFISNTRLKLAKNQGCGHAWAELLLFENYALFSSMLSSKTNMTCSKTVL